MKQIGRLQFPGQFWSAMSLVVVLVGGSISFNLRAATGFTNAAINLPGLDDGWVSWGDYDNDGRLDALVIGWNGSDDVTQLWRNTGSGFVNVNVGFPGVSEGVALWGDFDNDGKLDVLLTGISSNVPITQVWRNTGTGFSNINAGLTGVFFASAAWGDFDNDGKLDIVLAGYADAPLSRPVTEIWRNTGAGFSNINAGITAVYNSSVAWGDYDGDGKLDLLVAGRTDTGIPVTQVWRNTGTGFSNINAGLTGIYRGSAAWRDYDNDGRLDILLAGQTTATTGETVEIWRNTGSGFTNSGIAIPPVHWPSVTWGDYDNDGWPDILVTGWRGGTTAVGEIWRNTGSNFVNSGINLPAIYLSATDWGDFNNDGRLDLLLQGYTKTNLITQIWGNASVAGNTAPTAPGTLAAVVAGSGARLSWTAATDTQTPTAGLTYNVRVGTSSGAGNIVSAHSSSGGGRLVPAAGNCGQRLFMSLTNLAPGVYYWSAQTVDSVMAGSVFATEKSFVIGTVVMSVTNPPGKVIIQGRATGPGSYTLLGSSNMVSWMTVASLTAGADGSMAWTNSSPSGFRFYRLRKP